MGISGKQFPKLHKPFGFSGEKTEAFSFQKYLQRFKFFDFSKHIAQLSLEFIMAKISAQPPPKLLELDRHAGN